LKGSFELGVTIRIPALLLPPPLLLPLLLLLFTLPHCLWM
jgi:hypothetical protein